MTEHFFGRREPSDFIHVERYPLAAAAPLPVPTNVVKTLPFTAALKRNYAQGKTNGCVGASLSQMMAWYNDAAIRYDWQWLWTEAKRIDEFPDTVPGDNNGTSVRAGFDVLRKQGLVRLTAKGGVRKQPKPDPADGILSNYWVTDVDQMRAVVAQGFPLEFGSAFTAAMANPVQKDGKFRMPETSDFRDVIGGHAFGFYGADDNRACFLMPNTWSAAWPDPKGVALFCEVPYSLVKQLFGKQGECGVAVDRATAKALGLAPMDETEERP